MFLFLTIILFIYLFLKFLVLEMEPRALSMLCIKLYYWAAVLAPWFFELNALKKHWVIFQTDLWG